MMPTDLENSMNEIRRLKKTVNGLHEQVSFFKVAAEKYQKRAIYFRKKYAQLVAKTKNNGTNTDLQSVNSAGASNSGDDKMRLRCSKLQQTINGHKEAMQEKVEEISKLKAKVAQMSQLSKFRLEAEKYAKTCDKLT